MSEPVNEPVDETVCVSVLGPVRVWRGGALTGPQGAKRRGLLGLLAVEANRVVSVDTIVDGLWGDRPPSSAHNLVQTYVSAWRRALDPSRPAGQQGQRLRTVGSGYELRLGPAECDLVRFEELVATGTALVADGRYGAAERALADAVGLWRGEPLADVRALAFTGDAVPALHRRRAAVVEQWSHACLAGNAGDLSAVGSALELLRAEQPLRERTVELLMWALCRDGRPAEALHLYDAARHDLAEQLGADPGPSLRAMHADVLAGAARVAPRGDRAVPRPRRATSFVGREVELAEVAKLLAEHRLVSLTGPGGSGKTRLAEEVAATVATRVISVDLVGLRDSALVPAAIAEATGLAPEDATESRIADALRDSEALLVVDNLEHLPGAGQLLDRLVRATRNLTVLATSRHQLGSEAEYRYPVLPLPLPRPGDTDDARVRATPSVSLLLDRASAAEAAARVASASAGDLSRLVTSLDGLPLAIEIAAPWLAVLSIEHLTERLDDLPARGGSPAGDGHATLTAVVEWSFRLLDPPLQRVLLRFSVFHGSAPLDAIDEVCNYDVEEPVLATVAALVDRNLLVAVDSARMPRFRMLETIRQFASRLLTQSVHHDDAVARHTRWYAGWATQLARHTEGPEAKEWLADAAADIHNLRAMLDARAGTPGHLQLLVDCSGLWHELGQLGEGVSRLQRALDAAPDDDPARPAAMAIYAWLLLPVDGVRAHDVAQEALRRTRRQGDPLLHACALQVAGFAHPDRHEAVRLLRSAIAESDEARGRDARHAFASPAAIRSGASHGLLVRVQFRDAAAAIELCRDQIRAARAESDDFASVQFTIQLTLALLSAGHIDEAAGLPCYDLAPLTAGGRYNAAVAAGLLALRRGRHGEAAACFARAWESARDRGALFPLAVSCGWAVTVAVDAQQPGTVREMLADTEGRVAAGDARTRSVVAVSRARLCRAVGDHRQAREILDRCSHVADTDELTPAVMAWLVESALAAARRGDRAAARRHVDSLQARSTATGIVVPPWEERALGFDPACAE